MTKASKSCPIIKDEGRLQSGMAAVNRRAKLAPSGDPIFMEPFWMQNAVNSAIVISGWHRLGYWNAVTEARYVVFGIGAMQLISAAIFALASENVSSPSNILATIPYYPVINKLYLITNLDQEVMIFSMSKFTGHAGTCFRWAVIKDRMIFKQVHADNEDEHPLFGASLQPIPFHKKEDYEGVESRQIHLEEEDKEQCSPVSVLDPLFEDDEEEHDVGAVVEDGYDLECCYSNVQNSVQNVVGQQLLTPLSRDDLWRDVKDRVPLASIPLTWLHPTIGESKELLAPEKKDICEVGGSGWFGYGSDMVWVRASMDWICRYDVQVTPEKLLCPVYTAFNSLNMENIKEALMKHATDAMKESRVHDFLASWGKPSRANEGRRRKGGKSSCYH
ncbi:pyridoxal phosphate-dependent transferase [Tanacetum coccineum]